jgi:hypothetical protein
VFDTKKGTDDESKKHKKNKRSTHKRDDCLMKLLKSSSNFTLRTRIYMWTHALSKKGYTSVLFVRSSVNSRLTFTQKSRSLSLVKFAVVVVVVELFVLFARARGTKDEKRASSSRSPALFKKWNYS